MASESNNNFRCQQSSMPLRERAEVVYEIYTVLKSDPDWILTTNEICNRLEYDEFKILRGLAELSRSEAVSYKSAGGTMIWWRCR